MHETVLTVFAVTALLGLISLLLPLAERFAIPYTVLARRGRNCHRRRDPPAGGRPPRRRPRRYRRHPARFWPERRIAPLHLSAGVAVRGGAEPRCPPARRRSGAGFAARRHRRHRLHLDRRLGAVADRAGRRTGLHHSRRDHRDDRSGRRRRDLSRHRGAASAVDPGSGREPVQRCGGDRDLLAGGRDADRRPAGSADQRDADLRAPIRRWSRHRLSRRVGGRCVHADPAVEPAGRSDDDDRLRLRDFHHLRPLPRTFPASSRWRQPHLR